MTKSSESSTEEIASFASLVAGQVAHVSCSPSERLADAWKAWDRRCISEARECKNLVGACMLGGGCVDDSFGAELLPELRDSLEALVYEFTIIVVAVFVAVVMIHRAACWLIDTRNCRRLRSVGRVIRWDEAQKHVCEHRGYFIVTGPNKKRDLFYVEGEEPDDPKSYDDYRDRSLLVEGYAGKLGIKMLEVDDKAILVLREQ